MISAGLSIFETKKKIDFSLLTTNLISLNISHNNISSIEDIKYFENLTQINISFNAIESLIPLESIKRLEILNANNNKITIISSLNICNKIKILEIENNNLVYLGPTINTLQNLKYIRELRIKNNPVNLFIIIN